MIAIDTVFHYFGRFRVLTYALTTEWPQATINTILSRNSGSSLMALQGVALRVQARIMTSVLRYFGTSVLRYFGTSATAAPLIPVAGSPVL